MKRSADRIVGTGRWRGGRRSAGARGGEGLGGLRMESTGLGKPEATVEVELVSGPQAAALQEGEIVLMALRPSRWLLALHMAGSLALVGLALWLAVQAFGGATTTHGMEVGVALAVLAWFPVGVWFAVDWRSHRYVLTNRRVIASVGVIRPFVGEAPLAAVRRLVLYRSLAERALRIGTIRFLNPHGIELVRWSLVSRPVGVRCTVLEALHKYGRGDVED